MSNVSSPKVRDRKSLYSMAGALAAITVFYNLAEGAVSVWLGLGDETFALLGFGLDSFVEVVSGLGVWHMALRLGRDGGQRPDRFERRALLITGSAFYLLFAGLAVAAAVNLYAGHAPRTTFWGIVISLVSILSMWALIHFKVKVGRALDSEAILADARCTRACMYLSIALLASSAGYEALGVGWLDSLGAAAIAVLSLKEGREAFQKARGGACGCKGKACGGRPAAS